MKKLLLIFLLAFSLTSCLIIQPQKVKAQDYIAWVNQPILEAGGYGMLYNWFCTQEQAAVEYGYLYNGNAVLDSRNICSEGWHIATLAQTNTLATYLGGAGVAGGKLKETDITWWDSPNTGATNEVSFSFRGGGYRNTSGAFTSFKTQSLFWTSTIYNVTNLYNRTMSSTSSVLSAGANSLNLGGYIRPIKDNTILTHGQTGIYIDPSGIIYPTICIGTQEWVACNIMTKHYRNGDAIPEVTDNTAWAALTTGARCSYNNVEANAGTTKKLCSSDEWVVPTQDQCITLQDYLGGSFIAGGHLKEIGITYWDSPNTGADNLSGFNGRASGIRESYFGFFKTRLALWTRELMGYDDFWINYGKSCFVSNDDAMTHFSAFLKTVGLSVRLLYVGSGTPTTYTGNDGTVYPVVLIGTQRWLARSLKETKWSDGSYIQNITDNTAWSLLKEAACCDINNDPTKR